MVMIGLLMCPILSDRDRATGAYTRTDPAAGASLFENPIAVGARVVATFNGDDGTLGAHTSGRATRGAVAACIVYGNGTHSSGSCHDASDRYAQ